MKEKIKVTAQQRANAIEARDVMWPSVPAENVAHSLYTWRVGEKGNDTPTCGSVACFGGWCAWWPSFQAQGVTATWTGAPQLRDKQGAAVGKTLFGEDSMFSVRGIHTADRNFRGTSHELVTKRLNWLIKNSVVVE